ncbi:hypothetical protein VTO42DRAFT_6677 [Malbranchea cinnamomea]
MAPTLVSSSTAQQFAQYSPAELSYLHTSLSYPNNPIRPDGRAATQFRPLTAETGILPGANGSARIGFADGTQAVVGVKAEVEKTVLLGVTDRGVMLDEGGADEAEVDGGGVEDDVGGRAGGSGRGGAKMRRGQSSWVEISIEIPGLRDDDPLPVFLAEMMREALVGSGTGSIAQGGMPEGLKGRLVINQGWHWRIYIDILLLSPPLSYPLPLLSLTTHLALLSTKLPRLISKNEEDPLFDDDWDAAEYLYPRADSSFRSTQHLFRPPVTLLVVSVGENIIFDPSREEIAVADSVLAVSIAREEDGNLRLLGLRTIDPPARMTNPGVPNAENATAIGLGTGAGETSVSIVEDVPGVWKPWQGGVKRSVISRIVSMVLEKGGVGDEVMEGLEGVEVG